MQFKRLCTTKKRQTMLEKKVGYKHAAERMLDKHPSNSEMAWPCWLLTGVEIQGQTWLWLYFYFMFWRLFTCRACLSDRFKDGIGIKVTFSDWRCWIQKPKSEWLLPFGITQKQEWAKVNFCLLTMTLSPNSSVLSSTCKYTLFKL